MHALMGPKKVCGQTTSTFGWQQLATIPMREAVWVTTCASRRSSEWTGKPTVATFAWFENKTCSEGTCVRTLPTHFAPNYVREAARVGKIQASSCSVTEPAAPCPSIASRDSGRHPFWPATVTAESVIVLSTLPQETSTSAAVGRRAARLKRTPPEKRQHRQRSGGEIPARASSTVAHTKGL